MTFNEKPKGCNLLWQLDILEVIWFLREIYFPSVSLTNKGQLKDLASKHFCQTT